MARASSLASPGRGRRLGGARASGSLSAFGLDVRAHFSIAALERSRAPETGRSLKATLLHGPATQLCWPRGARTICTRSGPSGAECFTIQADPAAGHLIWGEGCGSYLLSAAGTRLLCLPEGAPASTWQRFLLGQVLPFVALRSGLEIFHASAVALDGRVLAFVGPSGAGKTSVALEACRRGASFFADDVLALQRHGRGLRAHPGAPVAGVELGEAQRLADDGTPLVGEVLAATMRERLVRTEAPVGPAPLGGVFVLDRRPQCEQLRFEAAADARVLLACTFNFVLDTPQRLRVLLDVCALAAMQRVERIVVPSSVGPGALAEAIIERVGRAS